MALVSWPAALPQIPQQGSGISSNSPFEAPVQTEMEDGPARARRRSTATWTGLTLTYLLTQAQYAVFEAFVRDTLQHGSARFLMPMWRPGAVAPLPNKITRLTDVPSWRAIGKSVLVTLPLSVLDF